MNVKGDLVMIGNTLLHCAPNDPTNLCPPNGNNRLPQRYVQVDLTTVNSSNASLALPVGAKIKWARLYWGATLHLIASEVGRPDEHPPECGDARAPGNNCTEGLKQRDKVKFSFPGAAGYIQVAGTLIGEADDADPEKDRKHYLSYADVTGLLQAVTGDGMAHEYRVADIQTARGLQKFAGWDLAVVYEDPAPTAKLRNVVVYDGFKVFAQGSRTVPINFFNTASPTPAAKFWSFSGGGDRYIPLDNLSLNGTTIGTANNYFQSKITDINDNFPNTTRTPSYPNSVGIDLQRHTVPSGVLHAGDTQAQLKVSTNGDGLILGVFALVNDLRAASVTLTQASNLVTNQCPTDSSKLFDEIAYTITVANNGNDTAKDVVIIDPIPANTRYKANSASGPGARFVTAPSGGSWVEFTVASLAPGASTVVSFTVTGIACGATTNQPAASFTAAASGVACQVQSNPLPNTIGNCSVDCKPPDPSPTPTQLQVVKQSQDLNGGCLKPGDILEYTVTITNPPNQTATAQSVVLGDGIPSFTTYVPGSLNVVAGENAGAKTDCHIASCDPRDQAYLHSQVNFPATTFPPHVVFHLGKNATSCIGGSLAPGESTTISFQVRVNPATPAGTVIENGAYVFYPAPTYNGAIAGPMNTIITIDAVGGTFCATTPSPGGTLTTINSNIARDIVCTEADLALTQTGTTEACVGASINYAIQVVNNGPDAADNVIVQDTLPENVSLQAKPSNCTLSPTDSRALTCTLGQMGIGETRTINLTVLPNAAAIGTIANEACVSSSTFDPLPSNNCEAVDVFVKRCADLAITKDDAPDAVTAGNDIIYTLKITNQGPSALSAGEYRVIEPTFPPAQTTLVGAISAPDFNCGGGSFPCVGTAALPVGAMATITYRVKVNPSFTPVPGFVSNTAMVATMGVTDPVPTNDMSTVNTAVGPNADLQLTKMASPASVIAGQAGSVITYTINYQNAGPSSANGVVITDTVAANLIPVGTITAAGLSCNGATASAGVQFTCVPNANAFGANPSGVLPAGASGVGVLSFQVRVPASVPAGTLVSNVAMISTAGLNATPDPNTANNRQSTSTLVTTSAGLAITKLAPATVIAGNQLTYTLSVSNAGPSDAANVVVNDPLPAGVTFVLVTSSDPGFACANANNAVTCSKAVFVTGASASFTITAKVNSDVPGGATLNNEATIAATTSDSNTNDNRATATTTVRTDANLTIIKTDNPDPVIAGGNLTYHITVANAGPSDARSVVLIDLLPNSPSNAVTFVSSTGTGVFAAAGACTLVGKVLTCTATPGGILKAGEAANLDVIVRVNPNLIAGANLTNSATVNWTDTTTPPANTATATATTQVLRECDLMLTLTDSPQAVIAGNDVIYTIKVTNKGPSGLNPGEYEVRQAVFPPAQTTLVGSINAPGFDCDGGANFPCLNIGQLAPGAMATITYRVKVNANFAPIPGFVANAARVALAGEPFRADDIARKETGKNAAQQLGVVDPDQTNNSAAVNTAVGPNADLQLAKTAAPASVVAGLANSIITYTINYQNSGPSNANGVVISDTVSANLIPSGVIVAPGLSCNGATAAAGVQFNCTPNANAFGANAAGVLPAGASGTLTFQARVPASVAAGTLITNGATIASTGANATPDPNTANNTQQPTSTLVTTTADLSITKSGAPNPVTAGNNLTYTLTINNSGPSEASSVVVTDNLPANLTFVSSTSSDPGFACAVSNNKVTCTKTAFAASASATITIIGKVKAETPNGALLTNTATIASASADPNNANNSANATTRVVTDATVTIAQSDNPDPVVAGTNFTYRLSIASTGPSDARDVILTDILPNAPANAITFVSVTGTGIFAPAGVCSQASGILVCDATGANLKAGETANIDVVLKVNADVPAGTLLANTATVNWTDGVPDPDSATAVETTTVKHESDLSITKEAPTDVGAGQRFDYRLTVRSAGPSDVLGGAAAGTMTVVDTLPAGVAPVLPLSSPNVTVSGPGGFTCSYDAPTNKVTCRNAAGDSGNFAAGSVLTVIFKVQVASGATDGSSLSNCATLSLTAPESDPVAGNNQACASTTIRPTADLSIGKTAQPVNPVGGPPPAVRAGENIRYTLTFGNAGPSDAVNVKITDNVPGNTALVTATFPATVTATGGAFTGANAVKLACAHNATTNAISCMPMGNIALTPSVIDGVLPAGVSGLLVYEAKVNASVTGGTIVGNAANIASAANGGTTGTPDPNTANNTSLQTSTPISAGSQLAITKIVQSAVTQASNPNRIGPINPASPSGTLATPGTATTSATVLPGTELTYRLVVTNGGPSDIANIQVVDVLPQGVTYVAANQVDGNATFTCFNTGGAVTCNAPLLPAPQAGVGNTATFDVVVRIDPAARNALVNNARANGTINGFNQPVGSATQLTTTLQAVSDLTITKTHTPEPVIAGTNLTYTVRAQNFGPSTAMSVQITDTLPAGQTFTSAEVLFPTPLPGQLPAMTCTGTTTVTCTGTAAGGLSLGPNDFVTLRLTARVDACTNPNAYVNTATTTSSSALPAAPRNVATDTVNVVARPDLAITKTAPATVIAGLTMTYAIEATNNGPSCAQDLMISDALPAGTVFVAATASAGGVAAAGNPAVGAGGTVKFTWAGLTTPTTKRTLTIIVRVCSEVLCDTALANTAAVSYAPRIPNPLPPAPVTDPPFQSPADWDKDPVVANNMATATTTAQAQSDLAISKTGPARATPGQTITYTLTFSSAGPSNAAGVIVTDTLPKGFTVVGQPVSSVAGTGFQITTADGVTTVKATLGALGAANQCATVRPATGTITINVLVPIKHPVIAVINAATISTTNCLADPNLANNTATFTTAIDGGAGDPGASFPALSEISDQKAGSILFFPIYTSDAVNGNQQNTKLSITNISATEQACVHLFAVDGSTCAVLDLFVCLTPNQTTTFLASDLDPGATGFMMAIAVDCATGLPAAFNCLIGDEYVKFASGHAANLGAEAVSATMVFPAGTDANSPIATLKFDGASYNRLPRVVAADNIPSPADGNSTMVIINRIGGNLATSGAPIGNLTGLLIDDTEVTYSFTANQSLCQYRKVLDNSFPRTLTPFARVITAGRTGWMKFWAFDDKAIFGAQMNFNANAASNASLFNQGHNLHKLTLTDATTLIVPVFIPSC